MDKLLSIITVTYNTGSSIIPTIESVLPWLSDSVEYIIIDGESTDNTIEIIQKYPNIRLFSASDQGIYDAMNKGIKVAKGKWIYFINNGDLLYNLPIDILRQAPQAVKLISGSIRNEYGTKKAKWGIYFYLGNPIPHQGAFYRKDSFKLYNLSFYIFSDYHHNIQLWKDKVEIIILDQIIAFHSEMGISNNAQHIKEFYKIQIQEFGYLAVCISWLNFKLNGVLKRIKL